MELLSVLAPYIYFYFGAAFIFWAITAGVAGYFGNEPGKSEFGSSLIWPISLSTLIGLLVRLIVEKREKNKQDKIKERQAKNAQTAKKSPQK